MGQQAHLYRRGGPATLTNDFFVNLLDMSTQWQPAWTKVMNADRFDLA